MKILIAMVQFVMSLLTQKLGYEKFWITPFLKVEYPEEIAITDVILMSRMVLINEFLVSNELANQIDTYLLTCLLQTTGKTII